MNFEKLNIELSQESDMFEFIGQIIDGFEDFLAERGIDLPNPEIDEAKETADDPDEVARIYGSDYYELEDYLRITLINWSGHRRENES